MGCMATAGLARSRRGLRRRPRPIDFQRDVRPVFERHCFRCHGPDKQKGGLRLDVKQGAFAGGDSGPAIVAGRSGESDLLRRIASTDQDERMPPEGSRLSAEEIARIRGWIEAGAEWPETAADRAASNGSVHWAWSPLVRPAVPEPKHEAWCRSPVDRFIAAGLEARRREPAPEADRRTLIRRLYFDLIGLPPTDAEVGAFLADTDPQVYERLVDRLLASPQYGERWARHWLDVVHYGETHGYDKDQPRRHAWPYRDYVIRALNGDKPYSRFVEEQVAGDALYPHTLDGVVALGFLAAGPWDLIGHKEVPESKRDGRIARHLDRDDMVATVINTFNSLTVQCAQCHAHKFDPIPQEDYYRLQAVFAAVDRADKAFYADPQVDRRYRRARGGETRSSGGWRGQRSRPRLPRPPGLNWRTSTGDSRRPASAPQTQVPPEFGYHSQIARLKAEQTKWVQVDLEATQTIAELVLVGCYDDFNRIGAGFGFPPRYRIELSDAPEFVRDVTMVVDHTLADAANPGVAPQRFAAGAAGSLCSRYGHAIGHAPKRLHPGLGRAGNPRRPGEEPGREQAGRSPRQHRRAAALAAAELGRWSGSRNRPSSGRRSSRSSSSSARRKALLKDRVPEPLRKLLADAKRQLAKTQQEHWPRCRLPSGSMRPRSISAMARFAARAPTAAARGRSMCCSAATSISRSGPQSCPAAPEPGAGAAGRV